MPQQEFVYEKNTSVLILALSEAMPHTVATFWLVTGRMVVLPSLFRTLHSCLVSLQSTTFAVGAQILMVSLKFTICIAYLPPHSFVTFADLQDLLSQLPVPLPLLQHFSAQHHLWVIVDEDGRGQVLKTLKI
jgi:hypothetical protein